MKKQICSILALGLFLNFSALPKAEAFGLGSIIGALAGSVATSYRSAPWSEYAHLQIGNVYAGELPSEAYRKEFSVKGTSYLEAVEVGDPAIPISEREKSIESLVAAFDNGASYYLEMQGKKKILKKKLQIDGFTYEKDKRVNKVPDDSGQDKFGIDEFTYLYGDSAAYLADKRDGVKIPYRTNYVRVLGIEFIAEVYKFGDKIEYWYFFDKESKKLAYMGYNFYDNNHKLELSQLREIKVFSKTIPDMSVFDVPKKYQAKK